MSKLTKRALLTGASAAALTTAIFPRPTEAELAELFSSCGQPVELGGFYCAGPSLDVGGSADSVLYDPRAF